MRFFDLLIMSINNLRRRKLRTGLTVLGVVIGTASIVVMVSLGIGLKENTVESYASFGSLTRIQISSGYGNQSEDDYLVDATVTKLAKIPHVKSVSPILETDVNLKQGVYQGYSNIVGMPREELEQIPLAEGKLPDVVMACVGGGSNSIGMFADFIEEKGVKLIGVEAAGKGIETGEHASAMALGEPGVLHGMRSYLLQDADGNVQLAHSISAGLDYPGVGPEHAYLKECGRARYVAIRDDEAMDALMELCRLEGIIPAIESAHAVAYAMKYARERKEAVGEKQASEETMVICLSGRGDKDVNTIADYLAGKGYLN